MGYKTIITCFGYWRRVKVKNDELLFQSRTIWEDATIEEVMRKPLVIKEEKISKQELEELISEAMSEVEKYKIVKEEPFSYGRTLVLDKNYFDKKDVVKKIVPYKPPEVLSITGTEYKGIKEIKKLVYKIIPKLIDINVDVLELYGFFDDENKSIPFNARRKGREIIWRGPCGEVEPEAVIRSLCVGYRVPIGVVKRGTL